MRNKFRVQSAMEYLMTYGWAILIISVVLGALYQIGAFNSSSLTVRVPSGECKVLRTSTAVNLVGQCTGLLPKYVAQFDGASSYVKTVGSLQRPSLETFSAWVSMNTLPTTGPLSADSWIPQCISNLRAESHTCSGVAPRWRHLPYL